MPYFIVNVPQIIEAVDHDDAARKAWVELDHGHAWTFEVQELDTQFQPMEPATLVMGEQLQ